MNRPFFLYLCRCLCVLPAICLSNHNLQAQDPSQADFYKRLEERAEKNRFAIFAYQLLFNVPNLDSIEHLIQIDSAQSNKAIRHIKIVTLEPFGTSLIDSSVQPHSILQKIGNQLHHKTSQKTVRKLLLFDEKEKISGVSLAESERILRGSGFIRDLTFETKNVGDDSLDLVITTRDHWTFKTSGSFTSEKVTWRFTEYNLFGMGHRLSNTTTWNKKLNEPWKPYLKGSYQIPSIAGSFVNSNLLYRFEGDNREWGIEINRPFVSSLSEWAGGASAMYREIKDSLRLDALSYAPYTFSGTHQGAWIGKSFPLQSGETLEEQSTRAILAFGYEMESTKSLNTNFTVAEKVLSSNQTTLLSVAISNRTYSLQRYVFQFGDEEDIPSGRKLQLTGGYENNGYGGRYFYSSAIGAGGFIRSKYYSYAQFEWSTFMHQGQKEDGLIRANALAFLPLLGGKKWKARVFMELGYVCYENQTYYRPLNLAEDRLVPGYDSNLPEGVERFSFNLTGALFNPIDIIGFRVTPILFIGAGWVGDGNSPLFQYTPQAVYGGGLAISNKFLAQSDFKIVLAFFPNAATDYKLGSIKAWEYSLNDFDISKPQTNF